MNPQKSIIVNDNNKKMKNEIFSYTPPQRASSKIRIISQVIGETMMTTMMRCAHFELQKSNFLGPFILLVSPGKQGQTTEQPVFLTCVKTPNHNIIPSYIP
jgi:hypothetical protein